MKKNILLTGCAGFIGSNFIKMITLKDSVKSEFNFHIIDSLSYAGNYITIKDEVEKNEHLRFSQIDIRDSKRLDLFFTQFQFDGLIHFAAESHVDRSIENPNLFIETNIVGTQNLLNNSLKQFKTNKQFKYLQISTDEVYGSLNVTSPSFTEENCLAPNSPYSASKASADLLVRSYYKTYGLPCLITRCSNNYGPFQYPEKLIPLMISNASVDKKLPVYGNGENIRDWIHVHDHNEGVWLAFLNGKAGEVYNLGGRTELKNIDLVKSILNVLNKPHSLITFVPDRLGHDERYSVNIQKSINELKWEPKIKFENGLIETIDWYKNNLSWLELVANKL